MVEFLVTVFDGFKVFVGLVDEIFNQFLDFDYLLALVVPEFRCESSIEDESLENPPLEAEGVFLVPFLDKGEEVQVIKTFLSESCEILLQEIWEYILTDATLQELEQHLPLHIRDGAERVIRVRVLDSRVHGRVGVINSESPDISIEFLKVKEILKIVVFLAVQNLEDLIF